MSSTAAAPSSTSRLDGKVALVTGSSRGMGRQNALELASRGASLVICYTSSAAAAEAVVKDIESLGSRAIAIKADVSKPAEIAALFEQAVKHFGKLDIVVSNAGVETFGHVSEITPEEFDRVFAVNTRGQLFVAQQAYRYLEEGGRLVMLSSISAQARGVANHAVYSGSKGAVEAFARCLAVGMSPSCHSFPLLSLPGWLAVQVDADRVFVSHVDFGDKKITVNAIAPGGIKTDMYAQVARKYIPGEQNMSDEEIEKVSCLCSSPSLIPSVLHIVNVSSAKKIFARIDYL